MKSKWFAVLLCFAITLITASASFAQIPQIMAVGSSGVFPTVGIAAVSPDPITGAAAPCGTHFWSGSASGNDTARNGAIPLEGGTLWVAWDNDAAPTVVCSYLSVDSVVGQRLFLGNSLAGNATLTVPAAAQTTLGANKVSFVNDTCALGATNGTFSFAEVGTVVTATQVPAAPLPANFVVGTTVVITGAAPAGYNGTYKITGINAPAGTFTFTDTAGLLASTINGLAAVNNCTGLPLAVYNAINNAHFNVNFTDIRPEDGEFAYQRASAALDSVSKTGLGYGPVGCLGTGVKGSFDGSTSNVVGFNILGTDPCSGQPVAAFHTVPVGAVPIVIFYNTSDKTPGGLGTLLPTNINTHQAAAFFSGLLGVNEELTGVPAGPGNLKAIATVVREPMSGTYNTFEWQVVRSRDGDTDYSQETGIDPVAATNNCITPPAVATYATPTLNAGCTLSGNPAYVPASGGFAYGWRARAIGGGQMANAVNNIPNGLGYAFWSLGTFGGKANVKYLTVDGVDPLFPAYTTGVGDVGCSGAFNLGTFACTGTLPTFPNVAAGNYRVWSVIRAVVLNSYVPPGSGPSVPGLIAAAQDQAHTNIPDMLPAQYCASGAGGICTGGTVAGLTVFRSHYNISCVGGNNGTAAGYTAVAIPGCPAIVYVAGQESGGDMLGSQIKKQADLDYFALTGGEFLTWIE
jgi:hypothetical protein